ncbi:MAG: hypothetical protein ACREJ3_04740 [Polyangiaceae bacterium]
MSPIHQVDVTALPSVLARTTEAAKQRLCWRIRPSPVEWLFLIVGVALVVQYRWILGDATIYYRYADNFLFLHRGLVFNPGEFVEGYSSPLWLLLLVVLRAMHLDYWSITLAFGIGAYALFWYAAVIINRRLQGPGTGPAINVPLVYLATTYGVASYFTSGSESPLVQLAAVAVALYALAPESRSLQIALGLLPLVRNEFVVPLGIVGIVGWRATRRVPLRLVLSSLAFGGGWLVFRVWYYADFFPSTFYLKDKVSIGQGLYYIRNAFEPYFFPAFFGAAAIVTLVLWRRGDEHLSLCPRARMGLVALSSVPYVVKVGGDMMHFRFLAFAFCLAALSMGGVLERWLASFDWAQNQGARVAIGAAMGIACFVNYPRFLSSHPVFRHASRTLDHGISDAPWHRQHAALTFDADRIGQDRVRLAAYRAASADTTNVATDVLCVAMFDNFRTRYVHGYGLTDPVLARVDVPEARPGHKPGLFPLARDLVRIRSRYPEPNAGVVDRAIADGVAPRWMIANAAVIALVEARMYNRHRFFDNLVQALRPTGRIEP